MSDELTLYARVRMLAPQYSEYGRFHADDMADVPASVAMRWIRTGIARAEGESVQLPPAQAVFASVPTWSHTATTSVWAANTYTIVAPLKPAARRVVAQGWTRGHNWAWRALPWRPGVLTDA